MNRLSVDKFLTDFRRLDQHDHMLAAYALRALVFHDEQCALAFHKAAGEQLKHHLAQKKSVEPDGIAVTLALLLKAVADEFEQDETPKGTK